MSRIQLQSLIDIPYDASVDSTVSLDLIKAHIKKLVRKAARDRVTQPIQQYFHSLLALESALLSDLLGAELADSVADCEDMSDTIEDSQSLFAEMEVNLEDSLIDAYRSMQNKTKIFIDEHSIAYNYMVRYRELAQSEAAFAQLQASDRAVFVGSGPFPISAMEMAKLTGCWIDGVEVLGEAARVSREVVADFNLEEKIQIWEADGQFFDFGGYSVIFVGVLAEPKEAIMQEIARTADKGARVFCRTTHGLRKMIYRPTAESRLSPFKTKAVRTASGFQTLSTLALMRT